MNVRSKIELVDPEKPLDLNNAWFVKQSGFRVRLRERESPLRSVAST